MSLNKYKANVYNKYEKGLNKCKHKKTAVF